MVFCKATAGHKINVKICANKVLDVLVSRTHQWRRAATYVTMTSYFQQLGTLMDMVSTGIQVLWEIIFLDWAATLNKLLFIIICYGRTGFSRYKYNDDAKNTSKTDNLITSFNHDSRRYRYILVKIKMRWPRQPSLRLLYTNIASVSSILQTYHTKRSVARPRRFQLNASDSAFQLVKSVAVLIDMAIVC